MNEIATRKKEIIKQSFDFEKEIKNCISSDELKKRTTEFLKSLEWKNKNVFI